MVHYDLEKILPHNHPMILIDDIIEYSLALKTLTATVTIREDKMFYDRTIDGMTSLAGIEFMSQTIGCYAYFKNECRPPKIGFLLGARLYNNALSVFKKDKTFTIKVREAFTDNQISAFDCIIYNETDEEVASATVNVYQSVNTKEFL